MKTWQVGLTALAAVALSGTAWAMPGGHGCGMGSGAMLQGMDRNGDGQVTRAEADEAAQSRFAKMDKNRDGFVTQAEFDQGRLAMRGEFVERRFKEQDKNGDGALTLREADMRPSRFDAIDTNHDGRVTLAEMKQAKPGWADAPKGMMGRGHHGRGRAWGQAGFSRLDQNGDGKITLDEAKKAAAWRFERADQNQDGVLSGEELQMGPRHPMGRGRRQGPAKGK